MLRVRINESARTQPALLWDTAWDAAARSGNWVLVGGGLQADNQLQTAVVLALFTDRRCPPDHPLAKYVEDGDLRGWWGDGVDVRSDLSETEMGSLLWLLERMPLTDQTVMWAQSLAAEAVQPLVDQGAVAKAVVTAEKADHRINLAINLYARDGSKAFAQQFDVYWRSIG
ncbi:phage gp46-like protein [Agrobacterium vitis]|nr:phage gp46-like protein [Agrobacterium vitis]